MNTSRNSNSKKQLYASGCIIDALLYLAVVVIRDDDEDDVDDAENGRIEQHALKEYYLEALCNQSGIVISFDNRLLCRF